MNTNIFKRFIYNIIEGIKNKYPLCCVLEFSICQMLHGNRYHAKEKGSVIINDHIQQYVPCIIHRKICKHISFYESCVIEGKLYNNNICVTCLDKEMCNKDGVVVSFKCSNHKVV